MPPDPSARAVLRAELRQLLVECAPDLDGALTDDTPLISSGRVESTALLSVAIWVEERVDRGVDISRFDLATAWDSVNAILNFVERHRPTGSGRGSRSA